MGEDDQPLVKIYYSDKLLQSGSKFGCWIPQNLILGLKFTTKQMQNLKWPIKHEGGGSSNVHAAPSLQRENRLLFGENISCNSADGSSDERSRQTAINDPSDKSNKIPNYVRFILKTEMQRGLLIHTISWSVRNNNSVF